MEKKTQARRQAILYQQVRSDDNRMRTLKGMPEGLQSFHEWEPSERASDRDNSWYVGLNSDPFNIGGTKNQHVGGKRRTIIGSSGGTKNPECGQVTLTVLALQQKD